MQVVGENQKIFWKTRVLSELWGFLRKGSKGVKLLLHPQIFCCKRKQHHYQNPICLRSVQYWLCQVNSDMEHHWPFVTALICFGLFYLDIQKTNSALLSVCETQIHYNNMASPFKNFTPAMYEYTVSKYCVAVVLCAL